MSKKGMEYDYKKAYDKNLKPSARLHYLENARHDQDAGSPNHLSGLGGMTAGIAASGGNQSALNEFLQRQQAALGVDADGNRTRQRSGNIIRDAAPVPAPIDPVAPMASTGVGMDQANPFEGKTFQITPANMMGNAKPMFSAPVQASAEAIYGSPTQRQMSMPKSGSVTQMSEKQEKAFGPGSEVYQSGNTAIYDGLKAKDNSMASMSPLEFHGGPHGRTVLGQNYSLSAENYADSVKVAKREKRFNKMMEPKMTRTITNMPYTKEQLEARNKSIKKSEAQEILRSEAQEIPRIRK